MIKHTHGITVFILCASFAIGVGYAQPQQQSGQMDMNYLRNVTPPSPNVAGLGKFGDLPVSLYTGVPEVSIPLYQLHTRSAAVPVTLSYHASGIRVAEIASWTGLGWSLAAGGVISRSMRGLPDEIISGYFEIRQFHSNQTDLTSSSSMTSFEYENHIINVANGNRDTEPDQFSINALGKSYKLLHTTRNDSMITQPYSRIKVILTEVGENITGWTVTLEDGTIMIFGTDEPYYERMLSPRLGDIIGDIGSYISGWHLKEVRTPQNEIITFSYTTETFKQAPSFSETDMDRHEYIPSSSGIGSGKYFYEPEVKTCRLTKIRSDLEEIEFEVIPREDLSGGNALKTIRVRSVSDSREIRSFNFYYNYSQAVTSKTFGGNATASKRLKLTSIEETSGLAVGKVWGFEYNPNSLPARTSFAQDHYGYFNNATTNETLLPFNLGFDPLGTDFANRDPHPTAMMAETLAKVIYPTGGYSQFNFEPNSVKRQIKFFSDTSVHVTQSSGSVTIQLSKPQIIYFSFTATFDGVDHPDNYEMASAILSKTGGNAGFLGITRALLGPVNPLPGSQYTADVNMRIALPSGSYTLSVHSNTSDMVSMYSSVNYQVLVDERIADHLVGGIRVRSIFDYNSNTDELTKRFFTYESPFLIGEITDADYISEIPVKVYTCGSGGEGGSGFTEQQYKWWARYSNLRYSQGDAQGSTIGYGKVTTRRDENGLSGKTVSYFSNYNDYYVAESKAPPYIPVAALGWRRGSLVKEEHYAYGDTLLHVTLNNYEYVEKARVTSYRASFRYTGVGCQWYDNINDFILKSSYSIISEQVNLKSTEQLNFFYKNGYVDTVKVVTSYFFDNADNPQWSRMETRDSEDRVLKTVKYGPLERSQIYNSLGTDDRQAINDMVNRNMLSNTFRTIRYRDSQLIDSVITSYKKWSTYITAPKEVSVKLGGGVYETRVVFAGYDAYGNLLQQLKINDAPTAYIYDYSHTHPIAQVVNSNYASIAYTSFEADGSGGWTVSGANTSDATAITGLKVHGLSSASVQKTGLSSTQKYVISFWYKGSLPTISGGTSSGVTTFAREDNWNYYEVVKSGASTITISGTAIIDELRLYPSDARMSTYTYDPLIGITSTTDPNNRSNYYLYDNLGRLLLVKDSDGNIVNRYTYNYKSR